MSFQPINHVIPSVAEESQPGSPANGKRQTRGVVIELSRADFIRYHSNL